MAAHPDAALVAAFLEATERLSIREAADRAGEGVSPGTVQRLREGRWTRLQPRTRRALQRFTAGGLQSDLERAADLAEELAALLRKIARGA